MIPMLYDIAETSLTSTATIDRNNGYLGHFTTCSKCEVEESLNGKYILNMEIYINDRLADIVISNMMILCKANPFQDYQYFVIESTQRKTDGTILIKANHMKNCAFSTAVIGNTDYQGTPTEIFNHLNIVLPFGMSFSSTITKSCTVPDNGKETMKLGDFLGGSGNNLINVFNGEFIFDNKKIQFVSKRGNISDIVIRYGSNLSSATQEESSEELYSHIIAYGTVHDVYNNRDIEISTSEFEIPDSECKYQRTINIDCSLVSKSLEVNAHTGAGYDEAWAKMKAFALGRAKYLGYDKKRISIDVDYESALNTMQNLALGDTVNIELNKFGTKATARVTSYTYDSLLERYKKIEIGTTKITLSNILIGGTK